MSGTEVEQKRRSVLDELYIHLKCSVNCALETQELDEDATPEQIDRRFKACFDRCVQNSE